MAAFERPKVIDLARVKIGPEGLELQNGWYIDRNPPPPATRCDELLFVYTAAEALFAEPRTSFRLFARLDALGDAGCRGALVGGVQIEDWRRGRAVNNIPRQFIPTSTVGAINPDKKGTEAYLSVVDTSDSACRRGGAANVIQRSGIVDLVAGGRIRDKSVMDPEQQLVGGYSLFHMLPGASLEIIPAAGQEPALLTYNPDLNSDESPFLVQANSR